MKFEKVHALWIIIPILVLVILKVIKKYVSPLFFPDEIINSAYDVDYEKLYADGIRGVIFDIDNTLVEHGAPANDKARQLLCRLDEIGYKVVFLSNNKEPRVKSFRDGALKKAEYIYKANKPGKTGYMNAMSLMNTDEKSTVFIGDQLFTDVWGAKRCGIRNILTRPIDPREEIQIVLKRRLEWVVLDEYKKTTGAEL